MRVSAALAVAVTTLLLLPLAAAAQSSAAVPAVTVTAGRADFLDEGLIAHGVFGGGLEWLLTRHMAVGPEVLYMIGPGSDRDLLCRALRASASCRCARGSRRS